MGIVQSKRRARQSEDVSDKLNHRSMFAEKTIPIAAAGKRGHNSTLPRSTGKSTSQYSSSNAIVMTRSVPALSNISLPPKREDKHPNTYIGLESSSRFLPDDWDSQDSGLAVRNCHILCVLLQIELNRSVRVYIAAYRAQEAVRWVSLIWHTKAKIG